jgi:hypothetical protein
MQTTQIKKNSLWGRKEKFRRLCHMTTHRDGKVNRQVILTALTKQGTSSPCKPHGITMARADYNQK